MNWKSILGQGLVSGALSSLAALVYKTVYSQAFLVDYSAVMASHQVVISSTLGCLLMALGYAALSRWKGNQAVWLGSLNILYALLSFLSIVGIFSFTLPYDTEAPELFPGMAIPMHFFPLMAFLCVLPFFKNKGASVSSVP